MTTIVPSAPVRRGDLDRTTSGRAPFATRRRVLLLGCLVMLAVVALAANYGPVRHYRDARARLEKTAAEVAALEEQTAALQSQLHKLGQTGYLEDLARQELTYARPDEELYIVTGLPEETAPAAGLGIGASAFGAGNAGIDGAGRPGFLERVLSAIASLF